MKIIVLLLIACLFVVFWYSEVGEKSGRTGENGKITGFIDFLYSRIIRFFDWMQENPANSHLAIAIFLVIMMILRLLYQGKLK